MTIRNTERYDPKYLFVSGVVKSKELELISASKLERMKMSNSLYDFLSILGETVYSDIVSLAKTSILFEEHLTEKLFSFELELLSLIKDDNLKKVFMVDYDFHNIKLMLMSFLSGKAMPEDGTSPGFLSIDMLKNSIHEDDYSMLPELIKEAITGAKAIFDLEKNMQKAMLFLDKNKYEIKLVISNRLKSDFLRDLVKTEIDLFNIAFLFRAKILKLDHAMFDELLLEDGYIDKKQFLDLLDSSPDAIADAFKASDYADGIHEAITESKEKQSISSFETYIRNIILEKSKESSNFIFGFEPLVGLIYAKRHEIYNLKSIYIAKEYQLSEEELSIRLGDAYAS